MWQYDGQLSLQIRNLSYSRGDYSLFTSFNLDLKNHQAGQLLGSNGSGKSTLLALVAGLILDHDKCIHWAGHPIMEQNSTYKEQLIYVGHKLGLKPWLTVRENILLMANLRNKHADINVNTILENLSLYHKANCLVSQLSAGQQQRLALARLYLFNAPLWLLDEPLTALDKPGIALLIELINQHLQAGGLLLISTHQTLPKMQCDWQTICLENTYA